MKNIYTHRFIARVTIEANSPIAIGSGEKDILSDALVAKDANDLPYIPGTALAGVARSLCPCDIVSIVFGEKEGAGSEIIFSEAELIDRNGNAVDGIVQIQSDDEYLSIFDTLPIRQHVSIDDCGTATDTGKFDEQIVFKGTRFCFETEMISDGNNLDTFLLTMAMTALGAETSIDKFRQAGAKPFLLALILFAWLMAGGWILAGYLVPLL